MLQPRGQSSTSFKGVIYRWILPGFSAYAGRFDRAMIEGLRKRNDVAAVEKDVIWAQSGLVSQLKAPYYLNQISHRDLDKDHEGYVYYKNLIKPRIYVVDTGIYIEHREFSRRAIRGYNAAKGVFEDDVGHGTWVAGLIGGRKYGVIKNSILVDVKVYNKELKSRLSVLLDGYVWATKDARKVSDYQPTIINMSLSPRTVGLHSFALNRAVESAFNRGISTIMAAGNMNRTTTWADKAIVVGATDRHRRRAIWSNFGPDVSIFAPGSDIRSAALGPTGNETIVNNGTSGSAPLVTGVIASLQALHNIRKPRLVKDLLFTLATPGIVADAQGAKNRFLYNGSGR
ncbi:alkaline protease [Myriangium duriaei CBS 260.36]|uniref:Alkaline protease n=1 Tax=Myriangium duriaei CBS 260.36 TaxID=1168546 RepID=A0A9P4IPB3_9PEZI|nr:alkaline protease [Myriangium duriaei CBS 260.36]